MIDSGKRKKPLGDFLKNRMGSVQEAHKYLFGSDVAVPSFKCSELKIGGCIRPAMGQGEPGPQTEQFSSPTSTLMALFTWACGCRNRRASEKALSSQ
eukprot:4016898-Karenia_brevis.AAC.1